MFNQNNSNNTKPVFFTRKQLEMHFSARGIDTDEKASPIIEGLIQKGAVIEGINEDTANKTTRLNRDAVSNRWDTIKSSWSDAKANPDEGLARPIVKTIGNIAGGLNDIIGNEITGIDEATTGGKITGAISNVASKVANSEIGQGIRAKYQEIAPEGSLTRDVAEATGNMISLTGAGVAGKGVGKVAKAGTELIEPGASKFVNTTVSTAKDVIEKGKKGIKPVPDVEGAVKQVLQGETGDLNRGKSALSKIDSSKVKTYSDLNLELENLIPDLSKNVDDILLKDKKVYSLENLKMLNKSKSGTEFKTDYVSRALNDLKEMGEKTGDDVFAVDMQDLINKSKNTGLTRKEVNDISRLYGSEFSNKAFTKNGDPLTSVNAQRFENTRSGLKETARQGMGGDQAKILDSELSAIYKTKNLVEKQVEAVNKLKQKIETRGWLSSFAYNGIKILDTVSGGMVRGITDGLLNRGAGLKTLNALDLEKNLERNLNVINKALQADTKKEFQSAINILTKTNTTNPINAPFKPKNQTIREIKSKGSKTSLENSTDLPINVPKNTPSFSNIPTIIPKITKKVNPLHSSLINEAKKYKSAEEFVKAQGTPVYHGTKSDIGLKDLSAQPESRGQYLGNGIYFTKYKEGADLYGGKTLDAIVNEKDFLNVSNLKGLDKTNKIGSFGTYKQYLKNNNLEDTATNLGKWKANQQNVSDKILKMGYKGVTDGQQHVVFDKSALTTKSQLTDIWNKANQATPETNLISEARKYKSAEEFVKSQGTKLYHGTTAIFDKFKQSNAGEIGKGVYFYDDLKKAENYAVGNGRVIEAYVQGKWASIEEFRQVKKQIGDNSWTSSETVDELSRQGFVGIKRDEGVTVDYNVFDPKDIKTKQELVDVWNKAKSKRIRYD